MLNIATELQAMDLRADVEQVRNVVRHLQVTPVALERHVAIATESQTRRIARAILELRRHTHGPFRHLDVRNAVAPALREREIQVVREAGDTRIQPQPNHGVVASLVTAALRQIECTNIRAVLSLPRVIAG